MIARKIAITAVVSIAMFVASCDNSISHNERDSHNRATETTQTKTNTGNRNENGELVDASGEIITGCPMHKEMIGAEGDKCPKCNYRQMGLVIWHLEGIDTVRVTSLPDYNPPVN